MVKCINHSDKSAIRLCDNCSKPFCPECLRKFFEKFLCQNCYPSIFNVNAKQNIEYEIQPDENLIEKIQLIHYARNSGKIDNIDTTKNGILNKDTDKKRIEKDTTSPINHLLAIAISLFLILFPSVSILYLVFFVYFVAGYYYCERYFPNKKLRFVIWLTIPLLFISLLFSIFFLFLSGNPEAGFLIVFAPIIFIVSFIAGSLGIFLSILISKI